MSQTTKPTPLSLKEFQACVAEAMRQFWGDHDEEFKVVCTTSGKEIFVVIGRSTFAMQIKKERG